MAVPQGATRKQRIALFGGTFDPIHRGHLFLAERARECCRLDKVIFLPCWRSPHKPGATAADPRHRLRMIELALVERPWAEVSDWEIAQEASIYSWKTASHFRARFPEPSHDIFWILGVDQWEALETWNRPDRLACLARFIVFPRHGRAPRANPRFRAAFLTHALEQSATELRAAIQAGQTWEEHVPPIVADYIKEHGLYAK